MKKYLRWTLVVVWGIIIWSLTTTPDFKVTDDTLLSFLISNGGHFIFFGVQAGLLLLALPNSSFLFPNFYPLALTSLYGFIIELVQRNVPGRSADPVDWILDTVGAVLFVVIMKKYINLRSTTHDL
jgi:hypothetical protein